MAIAADRNAFDKISVLPRIRRRHRGWHCRFSRASFLTTPSWLWKYLDAPGCFSNACVRALLDHAHRSLPPPTKSLRGSTPPLNPAPVWHTSAEVQPFKTRQKWIYSPRQHGGLVQNLGFTQVIKRNRQWKVWLCAAGKITHARRRRKEG